MNGEEMARRGLLIVGGLLGALIVVASFSEPQKRVSNYPEIYDKPKPISSTHSVLPKEISDNLPIYKVSISSYSWKKSGFGVVAIMSGLLKNDNEYKIKDIVIQCSFFGSSGTKISQRVQTAYVAIPAKGTAKVRDLNFGFIDQQSKSASCEPVSASRH